jgi:UDP-glucose 6-dehydrogenase
MQKLKKIVIIGGCGHVGLPLGIVFANCGLDVVLLDRDQAKIDTVNTGQMPFMETNALEQLGRVVGKKLIATADASCPYDSDAAIILECMYSGTLRDANADAVGLPSSIVASTRTWASSPPQRGQARGIKSSFIYTAPFETRSDINLFFAV